MRLITPAALAVAGLLAGGCSLLAPVSDRVDGATGTTIGERCIGYRADLVAAEATLDLIRGRAPTEQETARRDALAILVDRVCPPAAPAAGTG